MSDRVSVDVQIASSAAGVPAKRDIQNWVSTAIEMLCDKPFCEVSVRVVDEAESRALNRRYRGIDGATNVLAFPAGADATPDLPPEAAGLLGDIVICGPVVEREATKQRKTAADHWAHLLVHGALHLLGHDHRGAEEAAAMEALEKRILASRGVADPYAA